MPDRSAGFITIFRTNDPVELETVEHYLVAQGIETRALGTRNAASIGAAQHIFGLRIEVPAGEADDARAAIDALRSGTTGVSAEDMPDELRTADEDEQAPLEARPKSTVRAIAATFIVPGGSHWYAGRPWTTLVIAVGEVGGLATLLTSHWPRFVAGVVILVGMMLFDLAFGVAAVRSCRPDVPPPRRLRQIAHGLVALALVVTAGVLIGPRIEKPPERYEPAPYLMEPLSDPLFVLEPWPGTLPDVSNP